MFLSNFWEIVADKFDWLKTLTSIGSSTSWYRGRCMSVSLLIVRLRSGPSTTGYGDVPRRLPQKLCGWGHDLGFWCLLVDLLWTSRPGTSILLCFIQLYEFQVVLWRKIAHQNQPQRTNSAFKVLCLIHGTPIVLWVYSASTGSRTWDARVAGERPITMFRLWFFVLL